MKSFLPAAIAWYLYLDMPEEDMTGRGEQTKPFSLACCSAMVGTSRFHVVQRKLYLPQRSNV